MKNIHQDDLFDSVIALLRKYQILSEEIPFGTGWRKDSIGKWAFFSTANNTIQEVIELAEL